MVLSPGEGFSQLTQTMRVRRQAKVFDKRVSRVRDALEERFGTETADVVLTELDEEYRRLALEEPQAGRRSFFAANMAGAYSALAVLHIFGRHGGSMEDAAEFLHRVVRADAAAVPEAVKPWLRRYLYSGLRRQRLERGARWSQQHRGRGDWVFEYVPGDGADFDFGVDMLECGIVTFMSAHGAAELAPYLCEWDYDMAEAMGVGLRRTKTLALGCDRCDFRNSRNGRTTATWPPEFAERTCGLVETAR